MGLDERFELVLVTRIQSFEITGKDLDGDSGGAPATARPSERAATRSEEMRRL
jgi:hypothetical protein